MKKADYSHTLVEQIRAFLNEHSDEIYSTGEMKRMFPAIFKQRDNRAIREFMGKDWCCQSTVNRFWYFGAPAIIKEFVDEFPEMEYEKN